MGFMDFAEWWVDKILAGPFFWSMDVAFSLEDKYGQFASFACAGAFMLPVLAATFVTMALTAFLFVALVVLSPLIIPFTVLAHRRKPKPTY